MSSERGASDTRSNDIPLLAERFLVRTFEIKEDKSHVLLRVVSTADADSVVVVCHDVAIRRELIPLLSLRFLEFQSHQAFLS